MKTQKLKNSETEIGWWVSNNKNGTTRRQTVSLRKGSVLTKPLKTHLRPCDNGFHFCRNVEDTKAYNTGDYLWMVRVPANTRTSHSKHRTIHEYDKSVATYRHHVDVEKIIDKIVEPAVTFIRAEIARLKQKPKLVAPIVFEILEKAEKRGYLTNNERGTIQDYCRFVKNFDLMQGGKFKYKDRRTALKEAKERILARRKA